MKDNTQNNPADAILKRVGKRMPYTVPRGFFEKNGHRLTTVATATPRIKKFGSRYLWLAAASLTLVLAAGTWMLTDTGTTQTADPVLAAFDNLNDNDQEYLLALYDDENYFYDIDY